MAVLSVETKKISELAAATTLAANSLFVADMPNVGTQKLAYSDLINNVKDSLNIPRTADAVATSAIAIDYTDSVTQVASAASVYTAKKRLDVITMDTLAYQGSLVSQQWQEWTLADLLAAIRTGDPLAYPLGAYIVTNTDLWWVVAAKNYYPQEVNYMETWRPHAVLMCADNVAGSSGYVYNSSNSNEGGYNASGLRTWLEGTFYNTLPADLRSNIIQINAREPVASGSSPSTFARYIQLPSASQCYGGISYGWTYTEGGLQFPLMRCWDFAASDLTSGHSVIWTSTPLQDSTTSFLAFNGRDYRMTYGQARNGQFVRPFIVIG